MSQTVHAYGVKMVYVCVKGVRVVWRKVYVCVKGGKWWRKVYMCVKGEKWWRKVYVCVKGENMVAERCTGCVMMLAMMERSSKGINYG